MKFKDSEGFCDFEVYAKMFTTTVWNFKVDRENRLLSFYDVEGSETILETAESNL